MTNQTKAISRSDVDKKLAAARERLAEIKKSGQKLEVLDPISKSLKNPRSLRFAINAMCYQCMGGPNPDPGWKNLVRTCTAPSCALHPHRPYR